MADHRKQAELIHFLQEELAIPVASIQLALHHPEHSPSLLPMILWQYGLVTLAQLNRIFDWLEHSDASIDSQLLPQVQQS